ncbi:hypothetical protein O181_016239 [Austropuccinia psidii MF-1]|uniref:F-BAR domain-containing protein n=1 Tax=Austropuccinia psidii MF-1 TaxID=1389203 RepID=A0A9Q3C3G6_9BASI|nr:hypothetical protein [Austropuccinia psidii MF-1]
MRACSLLVEDGIAEGCVESARIRQAEEVTMAFPLKSLFQKFHQPSPASSFAVHRPEKGSLEQGFGNDHPTPDHLSAGPHTPLGESHKSHQDFCNVFWGDAGFDRLISRVKHSSRMLEDLKAWYKERASIELEYSRKLSRLSKAPVLVYGASPMEGPGLRNALDCLRQSTEKSAHSHAELSGTIRTALYEKFSDFIASRESVKKNPQGTVEKLRKNLIDLRAIHEKARQKYESDAIATSGYVTQLQLAQGRDSDKVSNKLDKVNMSIKLTEKEYRNLNKNLQDTTNKWNMQWKLFCDLIQDMEEDRIDFIRNTLWDYANGISAICVTEDEQCEQIRKSLERCDSERDIQSYVRQAATGNEYTLGPSYVNYATGEDPRPLVILTSNFIRSSTRKPEDTTLVPLSMPIQGLVESIKAGPPSPNKRSSATQVSSTVWENKNRIKRGGAIADAVASKSLDSAKLCYPATSRSDGKASLTTDNLMNLQRHLEPSNDCITQSNFHSAQRPSFNPGNPNLSLYNT